MAYEVYILTLEDGSEHTVNLAAGTNLACKSQQTIDAYAQRHGLKVIRTFYKGTVWDYGELANLGPWGPRPDRPPMPDYKLKDGDLTVHIGINYGTHDGVFGWWGYMVYIWYKKNAKFFSVDLFEDLTIEIGKATKELAEMCQHRFKEISQREAAAAGHLVWGMFCHPVKCQDCGEIRVYDSSG